MARTWLVLVMLCAAHSLFPIFVAGQADTTCSSLKPCYQGCCSKNGNCGFGPDYCGDGCQGTCDATAECGQYAAEPGKTCPLNVCCSQYGYCGTTEEFCDAKCQSNCYQPTRPSCIPSTEVSQYDRRVGYYEIFGLQRACDKMFPEDLAVGPLTHINLAFALFDDEFNIIDDSGDIIRRASFLKARYPGLRVNIAIGGWAFNDPPTSNYFSNMASTHTNRQKFISSLIAFLQKYALDGVDIDWEYPGAFDRGGAAEDTENYVLLMSEIRAAFNAANPGWEATITIPTSYWYMRGFDLPGLQKYVSWFNLMSYDLHGGWDQHNKYTGPYLEGHTNITEIENGLDLLWRNGVDAKNVVMGYAFYGRSFTVQDTSCTTPGCVFSSTGIPGDCSGTAGILLYDEIVSRNTSLDVQTFYDPESTVKYNVYGGNQWISYDDAQSYTDKKSFMSGRCLSGFMIWAIDQDTPDYQALAGLIGEGELAGSLLEGGSLDSRSASALSDAFGAYTGQNCFVTTTCTDGTSGQQTPDQVCPAGTISIETAHAPLQAPGHGRFGDCAEGWYRHICCPKDNAPKNCKWNGAPVRSEIGCSGKCGSDQFLLNIDPFTDAEGRGQCYEGDRSLCCDGAAALEQCFWTSCQGPIGIDHGDLPTCPEDTVFQTYRYDQDNGDWCSATYVSPNGHVGSPVHRSFARAFCCPKGKAYQKCHWSNAPFEGGYTPVSTDPKDYCLPHSCAGTETQVTKALTPPVPQEVSNDDLGFPGGPYGINCDGVSVASGFDAEFPYCCEPPTKFSDDWPVDPKYLFSTYYDSPGDDVLWHYSDDYANNDADSSQSNPGAEDGTDAYGFVMLDGPPGSLDSEFGSTHTITTRDLSQPVVRRSIVTNDERVINATFDHAEETVFVYCNYPMHSEKCQKVWYRGVEDTIIKLPDHVGEGPFARVVSMVLAEPDHELPEHHVRARSATRNTNPVYRLTFDYNFHLSKRDDPIEMRVDFTNLLDYWDEMTNAPASRKRSVSEEHISKADWHEKVQRAKEKHKLRKRSRSVDTSTEFDLTEKTLSKRWFGKFFDWLKRLNTFESKEVGYLELALQKSLLLFSVATGCPGATFYASLKMFFDTQVKLDATYAYYFSGTILPPSAPDTYVYFGLEPSAYMGLRLVGNARVQAGTERKKLIDTLSYPGLSVKGLAAVGPTLDLYGQVVGVVQLKGEMRAGVQVDFAKTEVYWPQDDAASANYQQLLGIEATPKTPSTEIQPTFDVSVSAQAQLDVLVTPQANIGIQIGGTLTGGSIVNAQLYGQIPAQLQFTARASGSVGSTNNGKASYLVGIYFYYNIAFGAVAEILGLSSWASGDRVAYDPRPRFTIFEQTGSFSAATSKRTIEEGTDLRYPRRAIFDTLHSAPADDETSSASYFSNHRNDSYGISEERLFARADTTDGSDTQPDFGAAQLVQCPAGNTGNVILPDFRMSSEYFGPRAISNADTEASLPGIVQGVQRFFNKRGLANSAITLTWDPYDPKKKSMSRVDRRRKVACPSVNRKAYCYQTQVALQKIAPKTLASCDEFPFAGSEEGGAYLSTLANNPGTVEATCVPAWQNTIQGSCNKLLSQLKTNVAHYERSMRTPVDKVDIWVPWVTGSAGDESEFMNPAQSWTGSDDDGNTITVPQRVVAYPFQIPQGANLNSVYSPSPGIYNGYMFRRNFTFGIARPSSAQDGAAWTSSGTAPTDWDYFASQGTANQGDFTEVACAVNTFAQTDVYQAPYNAYCFRGPNDLNQADGWGSYEMVARCNVDFGPANSPAAAGSGGGSQKRAIGEFNGWPIYGINIMDDDPDAIILPKDFEKAGAAIPITGRMSANDLTESP